ncbi:flagellar hook-length control protein FliK [Bowmanella sp. Y57]|uniref:Flagellar hook-length control protein FliK n=2 Tax=Bowmanella yangjiangensis TaxID=2811230 RepID=A0ABS3CTL2_9ALTE|nr:flagellar hook-length control protein FliK [Bowmanella yangjiangensis]MBN7820468.1 flagellar hook-length control protein FliK [Bowmanella yangjiangensis]
MMQQVAASKPQIAATAAMPEDSPLALDNGQAELFREQLTLEQSKGKHSIEPVRKGGPEKPGFEVVEKQGNGKPAQESEPVDDATSESTTSEAEQNVSAKAGDAAPTEKDPKKTDGAEFASTKASSSEYSEPSEDASDSTDQQADDWLKLVYQLVLGPSANADVQIDPDASESAPTDVELEKAQAGDVDVVWTEDNLALLQKLGLDPEVLQDMLTPQQLQEFKELLADMPQQPEEQMFAEVLLMLGQVMDAEQVKQVPVELFDAKGWEHLVKLGSENGQQAPFQELAATLPLMTDEEKAALLKVKVQDGVLSLNQLTAVMQTTLPAVEDVKSIKEQATAATDELGKQTSSAAEVTEVSKETAKAPTSDKNLTLKELVQLPEKELDKKLTELAERLPVKQQGPEAVKDFVASLKAGIAEFKAQLQQGREPGLDLQSLVQSSLKEQGIQVSQPALQPELQRFAALLENPSVSRQDAFDPSIRGVAERQVQAETAHIHSESAKAGGSQAHSALDKAINIAKPEAAIQLAERVRMLVNLGNMSADIRLDPPDLGSMQVRVQMHGEQASVNFVVQSQQARDMLDQAVPRLREMLAEKGIELGQSFVQQEGKGQQFAQQQGEAEQDSGPDVGADALAETELRVVNGRVGGIDYFV